MRYVSDYEISIDGYNTVRTYRNRHGGGVLIFISKFLHIKSFLEVTMDWNYSLYP